MAILNQKNVRFNSSQMKDAKITNVIVQCSDDLPTVGYIAALLVWNSPRRKMSAYLVDK